MKIAVVGATGLVGREMLKVLAERGFPVSELIPVASEKSAGTLISFGGKSWRVLSLADALEAKPAIALFSAGGDVSRQWARRFADAGCTVIDNSSAWRMHSDVKLVVPEINGGELTSRDKLIANPNCSTIQLVLALSAVHQILGLKRLVVSTYQSVSGTGAAAIEQLENERLGVEGKMVYPYPIFMNCLPHAGEFEADGYTAEELKLVNESRKILNHPALQVSATVVRVPVRGGHSEAVNVETERPFTMEQVRQIMSQTSGVVVLDEPNAKSYPMPLYAAGKDEVFVGRLRRDTTLENGFNVWIVADNLRKGAATNAVQIAELVAGLN